MKISFLKNSSFVKKLLSIAAASVLAIPTIAQSPISPPPFPLWSIKDGKLVDPNGKPFVFRGVTINHTLAPEKTLQALKDIAALGANSAQIEFAIKPTWISGESPRKITLELRDVIKTCKDNKLICVLEANDASGYSQSSGSLSPSYVASYWGLPDMHDILKDSQAHIIIGFSNQIFDSYYSSTQYAIRMQTYLSELRSALPAGFLVMVDGNKWGQDTDKAMLDFATQNKQYQYYQNIIYSIDMFDAYTDPVKVWDYIASFAQLGAPLVVGGFGPVPYYHPHNTGPRPAVALGLPAQAVMQYAEQYGAGYFGWGWSGNQNAELDVVNNWDINSLTQWGNLLFNDANGIKATAKLASIFNSSASSVSSSSSSASNSPPTAALTASVNYQRCEVVDGVASAAGSTDPDGDVLTYNWEVTNNFSSSSIYTASGPTLRFGMDAVRIYTVKLIVSDGKGGTATTSTTLSHSYSDYCVSSSSMSSSSAPIIRSSSSSVPPSSVPSSSSLSSGRSSSSQATTASCSYVVDSQWNNGFTAVIRIKNTGVQPINGWNVNWQYGDGSRVTNLWNASLTGSNPYNAKNLTWNSTIQPGQTVEFGFQGSKAAGAASVPVITGGICQ